MNNDVATVLSETQTDDLSMQLQRMEAERTHAMIWSVVVGAIIGLAIGVAQLIYIGSWDLFYWEFMPLIPLFSALGWALFGMILGGSGLFSKSNPSTKESESTETHPINHAA